MLMAISVEKFARVEKATIAKSSSRHRMKPRGSFTTSKFACCNCIFSLHLYVCKIIFRSSQSIFFHSPNIRRMKMIMKKNVQFFAHKKKQNKPKHQCCTTRQCAHHHQFNFQYFPSSISKQQLAKSKFLQIFGILTIYLEEPSLD